ncbi:hypothetical protein PV05_09542 [Exophiala xenobiotica]|uniref:RRM domain-containing protein n=1 Tax=Exophiala xenobiotica TaxID=348802 RepID=A0A0D2ESG1_9EURO|nr:uncharacterized protein PV05_09542 [Exophiala xenobiotica]KIW50754.1 hypothetical protein PV05_09542 [Exophiala xenobiotica]
MTFTKPSDCLLKYPSMERQDLNQSQLGSFKFTPVDNIPSVSPVAMQYFPANMDPAAATFMPSNTTSTLPSPTLSAPRSVTLCLALANEQQAHNATRLELNQEVQRCLELEAQIKKHVQQIASLTVTVNNLGAIIKHNINKDNHTGTKTERGGSVAEDEEDTAVASSESIPSAPQRIVVKMPSTFEGEPKWSVNKDNPIFNDDEEMWRVCDGATAEWIRNSPFPEHPVRYLPEKAVGSLNAYRTVMIDEIPLGTTLKDVLEVVRGGTLQSIQLFPPIGRVCPYMTARIVFVYEASANEMYKQQENAPFIINGAPVRTWKPTDPTYPCSAEVEEAMFSDEQATRIVLIGEIMDDKFAMLEPKMKRFKLDHAVIEYSWTFDGYGSVEFTDVKTAIKAMKELKRDHDFVGAFFRYDDDYTRRAY